MISGGRVNAAVVQATPVAFDLDLGEIAEGKYDFDVVGHYARPDVFRLWVNEQPMPAVLVDHTETIGPPTGSERPSQPPVPRA